MKLETQLNAVDLALRTEAIDGFVPAKVCDIHAHVLEPTGYAPESLGPHLRGLTISPASYRAAMELILPGRITEALFFPFPSRKHDRPAVNRWMYAESARQAAPFKAGAIAIVSPTDDPGPTEEAMAAGVCHGLKPYHFYVDRADTSQVALEEFAPEWMWRQCDRHGAILMLHLMRDASVSDPVNRGSLLWLSEKYPNCQAVLAHVARSFNHRTVRGLRALADRPNICVDTSAITESEGMRFALDVIGPGRVLYGSDYPISHLRGRCVTTGNQMLWLYAEENKAPGMTYIGIESLLSLREACRQVGLGAADVQRIFRDNALALLARFHSRG
jgi:glutamate-1-semialdehyde 2,1-aminomutase